MTQRRVIPTIDIGDGYTLRPVTDESYLKGFADTVNQEEVYRTIRHGDKWSPELIYTTYMEYIKGNAQYIHDGYTDPANFLVTWFLETSEGNIIGRGSFQLEDGWFPVMTNIAIAIKKEYHGHSLGKKTCKAMVDWFDQNVGQRLRWLSAHGNTASIKIACSLRFSPVFLPAGNQASVEHWGKQYLIFEREKHSPVL